ANAQTINVTLSGVTNANGSINLTLPVSFLLGDTNGDGMVNASDAVQTRNRSGQVVDPTNVRTDVNVDGSINTADATIVRNRSGSSLP
ncbi:MAG: dockerin type I domain-containing protein, partial [Verrucomicrobiota bacterium]|nr:dockerin type I domain-containing protein [Verrucomicrobiota bacterium]